MLHLNPWPWACLELSVSVPTCAVASGSGALRMSAFVYYIPNGCFVLLSVRRYCGVISLLAAWWWRNLTSLHGYRILVREMVKLFANVLGTPALHLEVVRLQGSFVLSGWMVKNGRTTKPTQELGGARDMPSQTFISCRCQMNRIFLTRRREHSCQRLGSRSDLFASVDVDGFTSWSRSSAIHPGPERFDSDLGNLKGGSQRWAAVWIYQATERAVCSQSAALTPGYHRHEPA